MLLLHKGEEYGALEKITMNNMIFGGKLPSWLG
jgi:hypothetical protein